MKDWKITVYWLNWIWVVNWRKKVEWKKEKKTNKMEWTGNGIRDEGTKAISELLESNSVLSELNLGGEKRNIEETEEFTI